MQWTEWKISVALNNLQSTQRILDVFFFWKLDFGFEISIAN